MSAPDLAAPALTGDKFLNGQVTVLQPARGFRAGLDSVLLAASLQAEPEDHLVEAGAGAGAALLCAAHRLKPARVTGFEREADALALAGESVRRNALTSVELRAHDIADRPREIENLFDQSFANPPFFEPGAIRQPGEGKEAAYLAETPLKAWVLFLLHVVKPGGRVTMIHRAAALADILELLNTRAGQIEVMPIRPVAGEAASRVLVRARKGLRRGPLTLHDGLTLHTSVGGALTPRAAEALAGAALEWR